MVLSAMLFVCAADAQPRAMPIRLKALTLDPQSAQLTAPAGWDRWLVQIVSPLSGTDTQRLQRDYRLSLRNYIADGAYLERADAALVNRLRNDPLVAWVLPYLPDYKLDPAIAARRQSNTSSEVRLIAIGFDDTPAELLLGAVQRAGFDRAKVVRTPPGGTPRVHVEASSAADLTSLTRLREVFFVELAPRIVFDSEP
jgi:hypothetical protein